MTLTMTGVLTDCVLISYSTPVSSVKHLLPPQLTPITKHDRAFWNVVVCCVSRIRPLGVPAFLGMNYVHVAYRLLVRAEVAGGETVDGLFFVRSDADHRLLCTTGNWMSDFRFHRADIAVSGNESSFECAVTSHDRGDAILKGRQTTSPALQNDSVFGSYAEAASFLKYNPLALSCDHRGRRLKLAEVFRDERSWKESPLQIEDARWTFLESLNQHDLKLELATRIAPINYRWRLGRTLRLRNR